MEWGTIIIIAVLAVIVVFAFLSGRKHMKGEGGCCGGSDDVKPDKKKLNEPVVSKKIVSIDGMHCDHCKNTVQEYIDKIDGAAARVSWRKKTAVVLMSRDVSDEEIRAAVEKAGFTVIKITKEDV